MLRFIRRLVVLLTMIGLLILNVLTVTVSGVNSLISGLVASALGVATVTSVLQNDNKKLASKVAAQRSAAKRMGTRLISRSKRMAVRTIASMPAKAIPILGVTVLVGGVIWELKDLCDGLRDVEDLYSELEIDEPVDANALQTVCHTKP